MHLILRRGTTSRRRRTRRSQLGRSQTCRLVFRVKSLEVRWRWRWPGSWSHDGCYCPPCGPGCSGRAAVSKLCINNCLKTESFGGVREFNELDFTLKQPASYVLFHFPLIHANCSKFLFISTADLEPIKSERRDSVQ